MIVSRHADYRREDYHFPRQQSRYSEKLQHSPSIWNAWGQHIAAAIGIVLLGILVFPAAEFVVALIDQATRVVQ